MSNLGTFEIEWTLGPNDEYDLTVIFRYGEWKERRPYGSTYAMEHMVDFFIEDIESPQELSDELKQWIIDKLEEDEHFYEACMGVVNREAYNI